MAHHSIHTSRQMDRARAEFDSLVVGSDQVWNPHFRELEGFRFLEWAERHQRICVSPSFGVDRLPSEVVSEYAAGLEGFDRLSVREEAGAGLIEELVGLEAAVLIDPTLVLPAEEWKSVASSLARPERPYVLTYFLGDTPSWRVSYIEAEATAHDCHVVNLLDKTDARVFAAGPAEFLDLIMNARCVFTDSFHGAALSLVFEVPVVIFDRLGGTSMNSRIQTFVRTFDLEERLYRDDRQIEAFECDYSQASQLLTIKRDEFMRYLRDELLRSRTGSLGMLG